MFARRLALLTALALLATACQPGQDDLRPVSQVTATPEPRETLAGGFLAPGDTLPYTLSWTAGRGATGYLITTTASPATGWSGMLTNAPTTALSIAFRPVNTAQPDSTVFTACVQSTRPGKTSTAACTTWTYLRLGKPGTPAVDSSQIVQSIILLPDAATIAINGQQLQFCPFAKALDGKVRFISGYEILPECQPYYDAMPDSVRLPGYPVATSRVPQSFLMEGGPVGGMVVAVRTPTLELAHLLFAGPFS